MPFLASGDDPYEDHQTVSDCDGCRKIRQPKVPLIGQCQSLINITKEAKMNDAEAERRLDDLFQETVALEKQFTVLREKQTPYAVDVVGLLQQYAYINYVETNL